jgi:hypothetical protein
LLVASCSTSRAARRAGGEGGVGLQRRRDVALATGRLTGGDAARFHRLAALGQHGVGDCELDAAVWEVDLDAVAILD